MDNKERKFQLIGFINPYRVLPAFVYPVFTYSDQYYYEDGNGYRISEFISAGKILQKKYFCPIKETKYFSVGDETIYAYQTQKDSVTYGNGKTMHAFLLKESHKKTNELLSEEINDVLTRINGHIHKEIQFVRNEDRFTKDAIRGVDKVVKRHHPEPITAFVQIHNTDRDEIIPTKDKDETYVIEPTKALAQRCEITQKNSEVQRYNSLLQQYTKLISEFYILYEGLVRTSQPSMQWFHLYDVDFCNRFIQVLILHRDINLREEDILTIYQRLNFKNKQFMISQDRLLNERARRFAIKKLIRETEKQMKINSLFYQMIDSSSKDPKVDISKLDIKYLEEV